MPSCTTTRPHSPLEKRFEAKCYITSGTVLADTKEDGSQIWYDNVSEWFPYLRDLLDSYTIEPTSSRFRNNFFGGTNWEYLHRLSRQHQQENLVLFCLKLRMARKSFSTFFDSYVKRYFFLIHISLNIGESSM